jgi:hypothetical protein
MRGIFESPAFGVLVYLVFVIIWTQCGAVGVAIRGWKEDWALAFPVCGIDESRC